jgi:DNA polymerase III subunit delta
MITKSYLVEKDIKLLTRFNSILFYGENIGLKKEFKKKIKNLYEKSLILNYIQDEVLNTEILPNEIGNISLFEDKKIIFIENVNDKIYPLFEDVVKNIGNNKIIFFADILDKKSKLRNRFEKSKEFNSVACYADNDISIRKIILDRLSNFKGLTSQNINLILENSNLDRARVQNELDKIISCFQDKIIDNEKLEMLLDAKINDDFSKLKDEALVGNKNNTNRLLSDTRLDTEKNVLYLNIINQRLNKLHEVSSLLKETNLETALNTIKPPIFWKDKPKFIEQSKRWNSYKINTALNKTYNLEIKIKSSAETNKNILIKKLLVELCEIANS